MALEIVYNHSVASISILYTNCLIPPPEVLNGLILASIECFVRPNSDHFSGGRKSGRQSQSRNQYTHQMIIPNKQKVPILPHRKLIEMCLSFKEEQDSQDFYHRISYPCSFFNHSA